MTSQSILRKQLNFLLLLVILVILLGNSALTYAASFGYALRTTTFKPVDVSTTTGVTKSPVSSRTTSPIRSVPVQPIRPLAKQVESDFSDVVNNADTDSDGALLIAADREDLLLDIEDNPSYDGATRNILIEQVESDFTIFDVSNDAEDAGAGYEGPNGGINNAPADQASSPGNGGYTATAVNQALFSLDSVEEPNAYTGMWVRQDCISGAFACQFPEEYDMPSDRVYVHWVVQSEAILDDALSYFKDEGDRSVEVRLNGRILTQGANLYSPGDYYIIRRATGCGENHAYPCLTTVFNGEIWYPSAPPWPNWNISIKLGDREETEFYQLEFDRFGNPIAVHGVFVVVDSISATITPKPLLKNFFVHTIGESIMSERCTSCHSMDTPEKVLYRHRNVHGPIPVESVFEDSILVAGESVIHCNNCHEYQVAALAAGFPESKWATPTPGLDIDWAQIMADYPEDWPAEVCNRIVGHLPTHSKREQHFHEDARLFWAVASGELPLGYPALPTAAPHNYATFLRHFDAWNDDGARCPE